VLALLGRGTVGSASAELIAAGGGAGAVDGSTPPGDAATVTIAAVFAAVVVVDVVLAATESVAVEPGTGLASWDAPNALGVPLALLLVTAG
jgi:hypothetical protein